jgi:predicted ATPase/DNA-binding SARP family transcriptional activator
VQTLGGFAVWRGVLPIPAAAWTNRRASALFKCLLGARGYRLPREQLSEALWPEATSQAGATNLRTTLHRLRQILDEPASTVTYLHTEGELVLLAPGGTDALPEDWLDAAAFTRAAQAALAGQDAAACRAAVALYGGDYLPDDLYAAWAEQPRTSLRQQYLDVLLHLAALSAALGQLAEAEDCLRRLLAVEPSHEDAAATLMGLLAAAGRRSGALQVYQTLATVLEEELEVAPSAEIELLRARLLAQEASPVAAGVPPQRAQPEGLTNLPAPVTSFVGRTWEMAALREALGRTRLVTLTGPGGCGKTRLALEVAGQLVEAYPDGVWLVEFAALAEAALVPWSLATALGVVEQPGQSLIITLAEFLRPRHLLLVLDNCEHLIEACATLATALLRACPHLRLLATSREGLEVAGERTHLVPSLTTPDPTHLPPLADLATYEAVALFVERAQARWSALSLTDANADAVAQICAQLDGLPLAIELAAARAGALSVETIAARLDDRFRLLTGGPRTALPRQQTLRATVEWSYALLDGAEQVLLRRLAVFAGGWTLEAAEAACAGGEVAAGEVLDLLSGLVHKSLVQREERPGLTRYRLLETIRQYAGEQLAQSGEESELRQRHIDYFRAHTQRVSTTPDTPGRESWSARLLWDHGNLRSGLRWLLETGQGEEALRLAVALGPYWNTRSLYAEGRQWLEEALARSADAPAVLRSSGYCWASFQATFGGAYDEAMRLGEQAVRLGRVAGDHRALTDSLMAHGFAAIQSGELSIAEGILEECVERCRAADDPDGLVKALSFLAEVALNQGAFDRAAAVTEESIALARARGEEFFLTYTLENLARAQFCRGELPRAVALWTEGLQLSLRWHDKRVIAFYLEGFAGAAAALGRMVRAARLAGAAHATRQEVASPLSPPEAAIVERFLAPARRQLDGDSWSRAWGEGMRLSFEEAIAEALQEASDAEDQLAGRTVAEAGAQLGV